MIEFLLALVVGIVVAYAAWEIADWWERFRRGRK
jgi:predicted PurR-regulated permease PerM